MPLITNSLHYFDYIRHYVTLSANRKKFAMLCFVSITLVILYHLHTSTYTEQEAPSSSSSMNNRQSTEQETLSSSSSMNNRQSTEKVTLKRNSVRRPCIEPHCEVQCFATYDDEEKNGIIHSDSLSKIQQQHLMIDMGKDSLVNDLINFIPPVKICPDHRQDAASSGKEGRENFEFYPLLFGFAESIPLRYHTSPVIDQEADAYSRTNVFTEQIHGFCRISARPNRNV